MLRAVPVTLKAKNAEKVLREMVEELTQISSENHIFPKADQILITASCKMAIKAGDPLSMEEMRQLVQDLSKCDNPYICPHGRPIVISLSNWEMDKRFKR